MKGMWFGHPFEKWSGTGHMNDRKLAREAAAWLVLAAGAIFAQPLLAEDDPAFDESDPEVLLLAEDVPVVEPPIPAEKFSEPTEGAGNYEDGVPPPVPLRPATPSARMKVRLKPDATNLVEMQNRLVPRNPLMIDPNPPPDVLPWMPPTYGSYIFIHHDPLLFEDIPAERYGEAFTDCAQPFVSFAKMAFTLPVLPYKAALNYHAVKDYDAYYAYDHHMNLRPGVAEGNYMPDYYLGAPYPKSRFKAGLTQAGAIAGLVLFLP